MEVAVTVTEVVEVTTGAVSKPVDETEPALAPQVTPVLKFPVPLTFAEHWLVCPEVTVDGEQLTLTAVTVGAPLLPPPPPPQASEIR